MNKKNNFITIVSSQDSRKITESTIIYPISRSFLREKWVFGNDFKYLFLTPGYFPSLLYEPDDF